MILEEISLIVDIILTIFTGAMAYVTYQMAKSTKESVNEMKLTRKETNSAEVIMYFEVDAHRIYLILENVGNTTAKEVNIKFEPTLRDSFHHEYDYLKELSYLPPNYKIKTFFDMSYSYYNEYQENPQVHFLITYKNIYGEVIERKYESNLDYLKDIHYLDSESETVEMSLFKLRKEIHESNKNLKNIKKEIKKNHD